jgi:hypothetical protein
VQLDAAGATRSAQVFGARARQPVKDRLALGAELLATGERQPSTGLRIDVVGTWGNLGFQGGSSTIQGCGPEMIDILLERETTSR